MLIWLPFRKFYVHLFIILFYFLFVSLFTLFKYLLFQRIGGGGLDQTKTVSCSTGPPERILSHCHRPIVDTPSYRYAGILLYRQNNITSSRCQTQTNFCWNFTAFVVIIPRYGLGSLYHVKTERQRVTVSERSEQSVVLRIQGLLLWYPKSICDTLSCRRWITQIHSDKYVCVYPCISVRENNIIMLLL